MVVIPTYTVYFDCGHVTGLLKQQTENLAYHEPLLVNNKDDQEIGMAHQVKSPKSHP